MIVTKFGGTSVADAERIRAAAEIVAARRERRPVVVVSALAGVTDLLLAAVAAARRGDVEGLEPVLADLERRHRWALGGSVTDSARRHDLALEITSAFDDLRQRLRSVRILGEGTARAVDAILAVGELLSSRIVAAAFLEAGLDAEWIDARQLVPTDERFGCAEPDAVALAERCEALVRPRVARGKIPVVGGFVGAASDGATTTLGRGGGDTSAAVIGAALEAQEIQIWTDVDGLMSADPRLVPSAHTVPRASFAEAAELAFYGAKVLHPDSLAPAVRLGIPIRVLNATRPGEAGTLIVDGAEPARVSPIVSVASRGGVSSVRVLGRRLRADPEFAAGVLAVLRARAVAPDLVVASEIGVHLVLRADVAAGALADELRAFGTVEVRDARAIVCVVGSRLDDGTAREAVLGAIAAFHPELVGCGSTGAGLAAVLPEARLGDAVRGLHRRFFERGAAS